MNSASRGRRCTRCGKEFHYSMNYTNAAGCVHDGCPMGMRRSSTNRNPFDDKKGEPLPLRKGRR